MDLSYFFNHNRVPVNHIRNLPGKIGGYLQDVYPDTGFAVTKGLSCSNNSSDGHQPGVTLFKSFFNRFLGHKIYQLTLYLPQKASLF
jgi:hypothetical protein